MPVLDSVALNPRIIKIGETFAAILNLEQSQSENAIIPRNMMIIWKGCSIIKNLR
jgi:hypothetical protein